jgi:diacylglycerol kinase
MRAFLRGFRYAGEGIVYVMRTQRNARVHVTIALFVILAGIISQLSGVEWAVLSLSIGVVFSAEMINTVAELAVDLLVQRFDPRAKIAKDVGAGAVLIAAMAAVGVGVAIFGPRLWALIFGR